MLTNSRKQYKSKINLISLTIITVIMDAQCKLEALPKRVRGAYLKNKGEDARIIVNYFPVAIKPFQNLYIFKVVFNPKIMNDNRTLRDKLLNQALPSIKKQINNPVIGGMNIYSVSQPNSKQGEYTVGEFKINIQQVKTINVKQNPKMLLHFLNNGIRNIMATLNYMEIGQTGKYFSKQGRREVFNDLSIYPGYKANFLLAQGGMFLRVDPTSKLVQSKSVLDFINEIYKINADRDRDEKRQLVKQALINKIVMTNYGKTKYARIEDISFANLKQLLIPGMQNLNILDYYAQKYNIQAKNNQPLLKVENKNKKDVNPIYILPQLCLMTGLPTDFDEQRRRRVSDQTILSAGAKYQSINNFIRQIKETSQEHSLADLGIKISSKPQQIMGKIIDPPIIHLGKGNRVEKGKESGFNLFSQPIFDSKERLKVGIIYYERAEISELMDTFEDTSKRLGIQIKLMKFKIYNNSSRPTLSSLKNDVLLAVKDAIRQECNSCLIVIRTDMKNFYKDIKQYCLEEKKIVTQVVVENTLRRRNVRSIHTKILLQMAVKCGNTLWAPTSPQEILGKTMLISFDVSKAGSTRKLVGVSTINSTMTKFASESIDLGETAEKYQKMVKIFINLVLKYTKRNTKAPREIIVLTNSCPKNQIKFYYDYFIPHVKQELNSIGGSASSIKLTILQTKDLSSERFFSIYSDGSVNNPNAGLLVANTIVSQNYDFYLVSQKPRTGSSVPIHFNVISSDSTVEEGVLQELMYSQCFNYANWTGSIKIPAIMQYAKKFARFASEVLKGSIEDDALNNKLYFI